MNPANALLIIGALMIAISMYKLWRPSEACMQHTLRLPGGFEYKGCSMWGVVMVLGVFLSWAGGTSNNGAADNPSIKGVSSETSNSISLMGSAYADAPLNICQQGDTGWVYMGDGNYNDRWWFTLSQGNIVHTEGIVTQPLVLKAEALRNLRVDHFKDLTGTFLGNLLGYDKPDIVCQIEEGASFSVTEFVQVGRSRVWAKGSVM